MKGQILILLVITTAALGQYFGFRRPAPTDPPADDPWPAETAGTTTPSDRAAEEPTEDPWTQPPVNRRNRRRNNRRVRPTTDPSSLDTQTDDVTVDPWTPPPRNRRTNRRQNRRRTRQNTDPSNPDTNRDATDPWPQTQGNRRNNRRQNRGNRRQNNNGDAADPRPQTQRNRRTNRRQNRRQTTTTTTTVATTTDPWTTTEAYYEETTPEVPTGRDLCQTIIAGGSCEEFYGCFLLTQSACGPDEVPQSLLDLANFCLRSEDIQDENQFGNKKGRDYIEKYRTCTQERILPTVDSNSCDVIEDKADEILLTSDLIWDCLYQNYTLCEVVENQGNSEALALIFTGTGRINQSIFRHLMSRVESACGRDLGKTFADDFGPVYLSSMQDQLPTMNPMMMMNGNGGD